MLTFEVTKNHDPKYVIVDVIDNPYNHCYIEVNDHNIFLNPFAEYGTILATFNSTDEFKNSINQHGEFYIPIYDKFIKIY